VQLFCQSAPVLAGAILLGSVGSARAADWPQFLGPDRNGTTTNRMLASFPKEGPARLWRRKVGQGLSGPVIVADKALLFHRVDNEVLLEAFSAKTGEPVWRCPTPTAYVDDFGFDEGPRAVPAVSDGRVFAFNADGHLIAVSLADGKRLWDVDTQASYGADKGFFGAACSPLVEGGLVLLNLGGRNGAGLTAFAAETGKLVWKLTDDEAGYASPVPFTQEKERSVLFFTRAGLKVVDPTAGRLRFGFHWRSREHASVNAASPVVAGDEVLLTASYGTGAVLLHLKPDGAEPVWSGDDSLSAHYATPVKRGEFLYGFHGRQDVGRQSFRCIEWRTGKVRWSADGIGAGTVILAGDRLVLLLESGELVVAAAEPEAFKPIARAQILGSGTRPPFALADGLLVARDKNQLIALDVRVAQ
jgi:outer membrane protein assembly factor BamB